jgi:maltose O-acetyltransferase
MQFIFGQIVMNIRMLKFLLRPLLSILPSLRCNKFKRYLHGLMGYHLDKKVVIASSAKIMGAINVTIGEATFVGHETIIMGGGEGDITIGAHCDISSRVNIISGTHEMDMSEVRSAGKGIGRRIIIEDGVWIGFGATILAGVKIGYKSVIAAGAVVNKDIAPYSVAAGVPAKISKVWNPDIKEWEKK